MTGFTIIIPARLASSRLPEKLLSSIGGMSVLEHSYRAAQNSRAQRVVIAADDQKVFEHARDFGAEVVMTRVDHESGTDRLAECVELLALNDNEIIVNLQGDEPFMPAHLVDACAATLANDSSAVVSTLAARMQCLDDVNNPNAVKVVVNTQGHALYFSRAGIPYNRDAFAVEPSQTYFHHLGIYAYRANFLKRYQSLPVSALEKLEKLEQLRILDNGEKIAVAIVDEKPPKGIDTQEDLELARVFYAQNKAGCSTI